MSFLQTVGIGLDRVGELNDNARTRRMADMQEQAAQRALSQQEIDRLVIMSAMKAVAARRAAKKAGAAVPSKPAAALPITAGDPFIDGGYSATTMAPGYDPSTDITFADGGEVAPSRFYGVYDDTMVGSEGVPKFLQDLFGEGGRQRTAHYRDIIQPFVDGGEVTAMDTNGVLLYAMGGLVQGPGTGTSDSIPAMIDGHKPAALSTGEYVLPKDVVDEVGVPFLDDLRAKYHKRSG